MCGLGLTCALDRLFNCLPEIDKVHAIEAHVDETAMGFVMPSARAAFRSQRNFAKQREVAFLFTFEGWVDWWEEQLGPDWQAKRGCRRGQYVMARFGDRGPYRRSNVKCILVEDNHDEYNRRRQPSRGWSHVPLPKSVVVAVYLSTKPYAQLVNEFERMTRHKIQCIKAKHNFKKITDELGVPPGRPSRLAR